MKCKTLEVTIDLSELLEKEATGTLKNDDFSRVWTNVVMMPIYRIEYIIRESNHTKAGYNLDEAFYYGLLNRIRAFLCYERRIVCAKLLNLELCSVINRIILEDNISLRYFIIHHEKLDDYRKSCFRGEIEFEDQILKNREERKHDDPIIYKWEEGLLDSIKRAYSTVGLTSEQIRTIRIKQPPKVQDMAKEVDLDILYTSYRLECHSTHGDWFDISRYFLQEKDGLFFPRFEEDKIDIRKINPMLLPTCETILFFLQKIKGHGLDESVNSEIYKDIQLIQDFDRMHFNYIKKLPLLYNIVK